MRHILRPLLLVGITALAPHSTIYATTVDYQGYAWETDGFPPSIPGDELRIPIVVTGLSPELNFQESSEEVTGFISGLRSYGPQDAGDGITFFTFTSGRIEFYRDPSRDHDFGVHPPHATVPSSFTNGTLCLAGSLDNFILYIDTATNSGAYEGNVVFTEGSCLTQMSAASAEGYTFGGVLTRQGSGAIPAGYDMSVDGFLEAQKVALPGCPFECLALTSARLDFTKRAPKNPKPTEGKFDIQGAFTPCSNFGPLDPSQHEVHVRIGSYEQVFPVGSLRPVHDRGHDEDEWAFRNSSGTRTLTQLEIDRDKEGWEFEIQGRGIPRQALLGDGLLLVVEITIGNMNGTDDAILVQKKKRLRFTGEENPCYEPDDLDLPDCPKTTAASFQLLPATPNPFNATTTIVLRAAAPGPASLRIYDIRGRLVRVLLSGSLPAGEHRLVWNGLDEVGSPVASGIYLYRVEAPGFAANHKMVVAK